MLTIEKNWPKDNFPFYPIRFAALKTELQETVLAKLLPPSGEINGVPVWRQQALDKLYKSLRPRSNTHMVRLPRGTMKQIHATLGITRTTPFEFIAYGEKRYNHVPRGPSKTSDCAKPRFRVRAGSQPF